jgi:hypothetical protein
MARHGEVGIVRMMRARERTDDILGALQLDRAQRAGD